MTAPLLTPPADAPPALSLPRAAWLVVALLWPVALLNYLDRQLLAVMKTSVMGDIPSVATEANWGLMLGLFKWTYAFLSPIGGLVADRVGRRATICLSLFAWSAVTWWTGHVNSYAELLAARALMGLSEAFYIPAALAMIADYHTGRTRSRAVGLHQMAIYSGVIVGGLGGYVADAPHLRWRLAFDACGLVGILYTIPLLLFLRDAPRAADGGIGAEGDGPDASRSRTRELVTSFSFLLLVLYFTIPAMAGWVVRDWMPAVLKKQFGLAQGPAGVIATVFPQGSAIVGALAAGYLADRWARRHARGRMVASALGPAMMAPAIYGVGVILGAATGDPARDAHLITYAVGFLVLFGVGWAFFDCNNMPILCQILAPRLRATGYGVMNMVSITCGGLADWAFGTLNDHHVPLNRIFAGFAVVAFLSIVLVLGIRPRDDLSPVAPAQ
jgi:MFS family permease